MNPFPVSVQKQVNQPAHFSFLAAFLFFCFLFLLPVILLRAADFQSARVSGLGGAGYGFPFLTETIYFTPAALPFSQTQALSGEGVWYQPHSGSDFQHDIWDVAILDADPAALFQAGVGYLQRPEARWLHVSAGKKVIGNWSLGLGWKMKFPRGSAISKTQDLSLSVLAPPHPVVQTSLSIDGLFQKTSQREMIFGSRWNLSSWAVFYADLHRRGSPFDHPWGYAMGLELPVFQDLFIRGGQFYQINSIQPILSRGYAFGLGWLAPRLSLNYSTSWVKEPQPIRVHQLGMSVFL